jgi:hypothetical protein
VRHTSKSFFGQLVGGAILALSYAQPASAWIVPQSAPATPSCPAIPDAGDVELTAGELERVAAGEIVVRLGDYGGLGRRAWAAGYLDANPAWLFEVGTDSRLATDLADVIKRVDVREQHDHGKVIQGVADASMFLPDYHYTLAVSYLEDSTGQCWSQIDGDFRTNEGSHAYLWDPVRGQTLTVMSFEMSLKGALRVIPDDLIRRLSARTLPEYLRRLESIAQRLEKEDRARAKRVARRWDLLRARLESDEAPGRVWHGVQPLKVATPIAAESVGRQ